LIEEATVDAYDESEQTTGFFSMIEENLTLPFATNVLGQEVSITKVNIDNCDQIIAVCSYGKVTQAIPIFDLPMPSPLPVGAEWIEAYRRWCRE
jgi:Calcium binding